MLINTIVGPYGNCMIIYKTTNLINGKFYVGKDEKNNPNYLGSGINLHRAIKKYGKENFIKETIEVCSTKEELNEREKYWIKETKAQELGYNIADGGWGGNTYDEETRQRISQEFKGRKVDPKTVEKAKKTREKRKQENPDVYKISEEQKQILSKTHKGKVHPEEWRKRQSEVMKELYNSDNSKFEKFIENQKGENKRGEKSPMWGRKATEETRRKQSEAHKKNPTRYWLGKKQSPESIEKRRQRQIGTKWSDETRKKFEENGYSFQGQTHTPEAREKIRQARLNKTPEQMLETYIKFHITRKGYEPSEEQKLKKLEEYKKKKEK
jgi:group I intron endonuclease